MVGCGSGSAENSIEKLRKDIVGEWEGGEGIGLVFTDDGRTRHIATVSYINNYRILEDKNLEITSENGTVSVIKWATKDEVQEGEWEEDLWYFDGNKLYFKFMDGNNVLTKK